MPDSFLHLDQEHVRVLYNTTRSKQKDEHHEQIMPTLHYPVSEPERQPLATGNRATQCQVSCKQGERKSICLYLVLLCLFDPSAVNDLVCCLFLF